MTHVQTVIAVLQGIINRGFNVPAVDENCYLSSSLTKIDGVKVACNMYKPVTPQVPPWNRDGEDYGNHYVFTVSTPKGTTAPFNYWGSIKDKRERVKEKPESAFHCILSD